MKRARGLGLVRENLDFFSRDLFVRLNQRQRGGVIHLGLAAINRQPTGTSSSTLPSVLNGSFSGRAVMRVVIEFRRREKIARKRFVTKIIQLLFRARLKFFGARAVGMMAKWSETFALLKTRLLGLTQSCRKIWSAKLL